MEGWVGRLWAAMPRRAIELFAGILRPEAPSAMPGQPFVMWLTVQCAKPAFRREFAGLLAGAPDGAELEGEARRLNLLLEQPAQRAQRTALHRRFQAERPALAAEYAAVQAALQERQEAAAAARAARRAAPAAEPELDADQGRVRARAVEMVVSGAGGALLVSAGPGAGKTTTLTETLVAVARAAPAARVLVLAFNVCAADTVLERLRARGGVPVIANSDAFRAAAPGCAVMTFDKAAGQVCAREGVECSEYSQTKERAAELLEGQPGAFPPWDLVVVDEAQDVNRLHSRLVDAVAGRVLLAAGDPRQEVYSGAAWFSQLWAAGGEHLQLARNYRSGARIVEALNAFSRAAFPALHFDQVAVRAEPGAVRAEAPPAPEGRCTPAQLIGARVGELLADCAPGAAYAVAPVTISRWKLEEATLAARQRLRELRPMERAVALDQSAQWPAGPAYLLATACRVKGTERARVVVYGADRDYNIKCPESEIAKKIFVALSRARDELVIVGGALAAQRVKRLMAPLLESPAVEGGAALVRPGAARPPGELRLPNVPVTAETLSDGGAGLASVPFQGDAWAAEEWDAPALPIGGDPQFAGHLAEAHVAQALHVLAGGTAPLLATAEGVTVERAGPGQVLGLQRAAGGWVLRVGHHAPRMREHLRELRALRAPAPYVHSAVRYTAIAGRPWTVDSEWADPARHQPVSAAAAALAPRIRAAVEALRPGAAAQPQVFWGAVFALLRPCREGAPPAPAGALTAVPDLVWGGVPVEFKHAAPCEAHARQLAAYMFALGADCGLLVNTLTGRLALLRAAPALPREVNLRARAAQALMLAQSAQHLRELAAPPPPALRAATTLIAVGVARCGGRCAEVGAVAVSAVDWSALGAFERRAPSARLGGAGAGALAWAPGAAAAESAALWAEFLAWAREITPAAALLVHWGGAADWPGPALDARRVYQQWLARQGARGGGALAAAAGRLFSGVLPFSPHYAAEDAIVTAAVLMALVQRGGAC